ASVLYFGRKRPYLIVGWLWYLGTLVPVIGILQVGQQRMADRYTYVPLTGLFLLLIWLVADLTGRWRYRGKVLAVSAGMLLVVGMVVTQAQLRHWQNTD